MKFLVVDPSETTARIIGHVLEAAGAQEILTARDGPRALEICRGTDGEGLALIVLERDLPGGDGLDLARALRAESACAQVPILLLTTGLTRVQILAAVEAGITGCVLKPLLPEVLSGSVADLLEPPLPQAA